MGVQIDNKATEIAASFTKLIYVPVDVEILDADA
jgi:hypothetical protein